MKFENYLKEIAAIHEEIAIAVHLHSTASIELFAQEITDRDSVLKQAQWRFWNEPLFNRVVQNAIHRIEKLSK